MERKRREERGAFAAVQFSQLGKEEGHPAARRGSVDTFLSSAALAGLSAGRVSTYRARLKRGRGGRCQLGRLDRWGGREQSHKPVGECVGRTDTERKEGRGNVRRFCVRKQSWRGLVAKWRGWGWGARSQRQQPASSKGYIFFATEEKEDTAVVCGDEEKRSDAVIADMCAHTTHTQ